MDDRTKTADLRSIVPARGWRALVVAGPSKGNSRPLAWGLSVVGSDPSSDVVLDDRKVSKRHLEIDITTDAVKVRDLASKNGTFFESSRVESMQLPHAGGLLRLGDSELWITPDEQPESLRPSPRDRCGRLLGRSEAMRLLFARIERVAETNATVLLHGETGTGKELVAEALHELGPSSDEPFVVLDCGALPRELIESEIFGHARGAFTGAVADRQGAFERANRGTVFLDEIGELELGLQPKLLRFIESGTIKPVGADRHVRVDVRVIAASHKDLGKEVVAGTFREDFYYRLSVVVLRVPPLRERLDDVPMLVSHFIEELGARPLGAAAMRLLTSYSWPGNVRQLRNVLGRAAAMAGGGALEINAADLTHPAAQSSPAALLSMPYKAAKEEMVARFTREYLEALLGRHGGNVSAAAREAKVDRNWIVALARRHGVRARD